MEVDLVEDRKEFAKLMKMKDFAEYEAEWIKCNSEPVCSVFIESCKIRGKMTDIIEEAEKFITDLKKAKAHLSKLLKEKEDSLEKWR